MGNKYRELYWAMYAATRPLANQTYKIGDVTKETFTAKGDPLWALRWPRSVPFPLRKWKVVHDARRALERSGA